MVQGVGVDCEFASVAILLFENVRTGAPSSLMLADYIQSFGLFSCNRSLSSSVSFALMLTLSISNPATFL